MLLKIERFFWALVWLAVGLLALFWLLQQGDKYGDDNALGKLSRWLESRLQPQRG